MVFVDGDKFHGIVRGTPGVPPAPRSPKKYNLRQHSPEVTVFPERYPHTDPPANQAHDEHSVSLVGQTSAALVTSSLENLSAVCGSHSLTETVFLASLSLLGLICSEHMHTSLLFASFLISPVFVMGDPLFFTGTQCFFCTAQIDNNNYIPSGGSVSRGLGVFL